MSSLKKQDTKKSRDISIIIREQRVSEREEARRVRHVEKREARIYYVRYGLVLNSRS